MCIHEKTYNEIEFFRNSSPSFISWICPLLKLEVFSENSIIYYEGDDIVSIYFVKDGNCGFILPRHKNIKYIDLVKGSYFGLTDIIATMLHIDKENELDQWMKYKGQL